MRVTYDLEADAAYIYLADERSMVAKTYLCDPLEVNGMVNLDFDADGRLVGIEVISARAKLSAALLDEAEILDSENP